MNRFLKDILDQPSVLDHVLNTLTGEGLKDIQRAAEEVRQAARIVLTSMGSAYYSCMPMAYALSRLHPNVHLAETSELMRIPFFPDTLYIIMSRSGESGEIAEFSRLLKERGERLIAITITPSSTLAANASLVITDPSSYDGLICAKAYTSLALTGLLIASIVEGRLDHDLVEGLRRAFAWMEEEKERLLSMVARHPRLGASLTFLSRGSGLGLAAEGTLWVEEGARVRASYSSIDSFLHGPVEQVDEQFLGVWIDLSPSSLSERQYHTVAAKGGSLITITSRNSYTDGMTVPANDLPEPYRVIPAALPVQLIAYQTAANRGLQAGDMRYVDWIIR